ncbi:MAG: 4Fe-4S cluster-binding domain-containing protein [Bacteroidaceae bacterium]|nr:4Fe-4S cluster-binding domain-containing protein [Bacteroidaceae bacterium]
MEKKRIYEYDKLRHCTCTLYMTETCNLNCIYCYEHIKGKSIMPFDIAQHGIKETFKRAVQENVKYVEILFHGGEPFMAFPRIKEICNWLWTQEWPLNYICYATTNGTLIHGDIRQWLLENKERFFVGLSLDGTREMHNRNRSGSYDKLDLGFFRDNWPNQGVKMTPSPGTICSLADGVIHIHELGFKRNNCSFATGVDWEHDEKGNKILYKDILLEQFHILANYYIGHPQIMPVDMLNLRFIAIAAGEEGMSDKLCGAGTIMQCWTPDGQCLPCHLFYEVSKEKGERLGKFDFSSYQKLQDKRCKGCILEPICPTCYGGNYITYGDLSKRDPYTCEITKIRALAGSWMIGQMLMAPQKYVALKDFNGEELAMIVKGVLMTQSYLEEYMDNFRLADNCSFRKTEQVI